LRKLFAYLVIGLLVLGLAPVFMTNAYAQITIADGDVLSIDAGGKFNGGDPFIYKINPDTGATISSVEITLDASFSSDLTVTGGTGIEFNPDDGKIYVLLKTTDDPEVFGGGQERMLATIDPQTGIATLVGDTDVSKIGSLTFNPGTLFSIDRLFNGLSTVSTVDGSVVNLCELVDEDGTGLARNSNDGLLYFVTDDEYQRIDDFSVDPCDVTDISVSGFIDEPSALLFIPTENHFLIVLEKDELHSLTTTSGADLDSIGDLDHHSRGLALIGEIFVGGELLPIDSTALMLAGLQSSAIWMLPVLAGAVGASAYYIKTRMNKE